MKRRTHPHDPNISNGILARILIWMTWTRIPVVSRIYTAYLNCDIGSPLPKDIFLPHPFGIVISSGVRFGNDVVIGHQVTIGNRGGIMACAQVGNRVYIGAGAKILGPVSVGDDVMIGANSVVTKDIESDKVVVGANRILPKNSTYWKTLKQTKYYKSDGVNSK